MITKVPIRIVAR